MSLVAHGLVARRPKDFAAMVLAYGSYAAGFQQTEQLGKPAGMPITMRKFETTVEWTYGCTIRPGLVCSPVFNTSSVRMAPQFRMLSPSG